jgi:S-adenosylmethionine-dependent methyltransferase
VAVTSEREGGPRLGGQAGLAARAQFAAHVPAAGGPPAAPDQGGPPQRWHSYADARTVVVRDILRSVISGLVAQTGRGRLDIIDAGGGTGGFAVPLAGQGHTVTVIDPSPDSLAAAQRRAAEMAVPLRAIQGDATDLAALVGTEGADLVLCHSVLEYVDAPPAAMTAVASVLRPAGAVSVLASSAVAAVLHRALAGRFDEARRLLAAVRVPGGAGETAPGVTGPAAAAGLSAPRRFTLAEVVGLIEEAGLRPGAAHGVRVFSDLVPGSFADADPGAADALLALEQAASTHPAFHDVAAQFHVLGYR